MNNQSNRNKMKTKILALLILLPFLSQATVWRVNGNEGVDADFADLPEAIAAANANDTLLVEPLGSGWYSSSTVDKTLFIYGTGYLLSSNDSTQYLPQATSVHSIIFNPGSEGSLLSGFQMISQACIGTLFPDCGSILLNTCCISIQNCRGSGGTSTNLIFFRSSADYCVVKNCIFTRLDFDFVDTDNPALIGTGVTGTIITNSIIGRFEAAGAGSSFFETIVSLTVNNCVITSPQTQTLRARNTAFTNCVVASPSGEVCDGTCTFTNTVALSNNLNGSETNTILIEEGDVLFDSGFVDHPELQYQLDPNSPGKTAGTDGTDCGIFGGVEPYELSGMPNIPSIFELSVGAIGNANSQSLDVNLKAKSHE
jgi:hypothetical protein